MKIIRVHKAFAVPVELTFSGLYEVSSSLKNGTVS